MKIKDEFRECLYVAINGKLQWFNYLLGNYKKRSNDLISMINELVLYYDNIDEMYSLYLKVSSK